MEGRMDGRMDGRMEERGTAARRGVDLFFCCGRYLR